MNRTNNIEEAQNNGDEITLFIGGFPSKTKEIDLKNYFGGYKSLIGITIVKNKKKTSKGFGYIKFGDRKEAEKAIRTKHKLKGKMFRVRELMSKNKLDADKEDEMRRKVFVGGINKITKEEDLEAYFSKFGEIEDILVNRSAKTGISKGCAFILFKDKTVAQKLINDPRRHEIKGKLAECKSTHKKGTKGEKDHNEVETSERNHFLSTATPSPIPQTITVPNIPPIFLLGEQEEEGSRNEEQEIPPFRASFKKNRSTLESILSKTYKIRENSGDETNLVFRWKHTGNEEEIYEDSQSNSKFGNFTLWGSDTSDLEKISFFDRSRVNFWKKF